MKDLFKAGDLKRVIIFSGKKQKVKQITQALVRLGINAGEMHSDLEQAQRDEMMYRFKSGQIDVLVATDILSRGIDIDDIAMVINYDVPRDPEDYVHRIGRTARAERDGRAITFVATDDQRYFQQIERFLEKKIERNALPEGLGEAPEMNVRNTKAKDRRRKDRDQQAHRRKPNRPKGDERRQAAGQPIEAKEGGNRPAEKQKADRPRKDERPAKDRQQSDDRRRKPQDNGQEQKARKPKSENRPERQAAKPEKTAQADRPTPKDQSRRRKPNRPAATDDRDIRRKNKKEERRNTPQSQKPAQQTKQPAAQTGKIGKVINWFRSLGKKK